MAGGRNAALPHAIPGEDAVTENCLVLIDVGCRVDAYCSDQTRTFWAGDAPAPEFRRTLALVREAQEAALKKMRPGLSLREVYALARDPLAEQRPSLTGLGIAEEMQLVLDERRPLYEDAAHHILDATAEPAIVCVEALRLLGRN